MHMALSNKAISRGAHVSIGLLSRHIFESFPKIVSRWRYTLASGGEKDADADKVEEEVVAEEEEEEVVVVVVVLVVGLLAVSVAPGLPLRECAVGSSTGVLSL